MTDTPFAQRIIDNMSTAVLWLDEYLCLQAMNPAAEAMLHMSATQAYGERVETFLAGCTAFHRLLQSAGPTIEYGLILDLPQQLLTVDCVISLPDNTEKGGRIVELMEIGQQRRHTREEHLRNQQQAAQNIVRGLAHEIKNPLGGLRGAAQLLARELPDAELHEYTDIIIEEADRLQVLLDNMLISPQARPEKVWFNVHRPLCRVSQLIEAEQHAGLVIEHDFDPSIPDVYADPDQVQQAVLNIARNAVQALHGQGDITIRTRIQRRMTLGKRHHKLVAQVDIIDDGPG
ncbi:MAG: nitrogen regulation protein NR(II), partial [Pseudomonadota bacterium]